MLLPDTHRLLIGLSPRILRQVPAELGFKGKTLQYFEQSIADWIMSLGAMIVMIPTVERQSLIRRTDIAVADYAERLDGLVLQGGADIDPAIYGEERAPETGITDPVRDRFELDLLHAFAAAGKPVLGICRGMQLINVAYGGTLHQDLSAAGVAAFPHQRMELYDEHCHAVRFGEGSWLGQLYAGSRQLNVNSIHHQGVKQLGRALTADAWSEDGVVECIRDPGQPFMVGVQWHPEFHDSRFPELLPSQPLLEAFLGAAANRAAT
jgi:gamma-glutamyl-gamma-aminobutyrate hydrolase PuuD